MKKILIIGAAGFVGGHIIRYLIADGDWDIYATKLPHEKIDISDSHVHVVDLDILDSSNVRETISGISPEYVIHLAAQSSVALAWKNPDLTVDINIKGAIHILDEIRAASINPRILLVGSSEEYGAIQKSPVDEQTRSNPGNIYAATKICQNMIGHIYAKAYGMDIMCTRSFNHIGPGQAPMFVVSDFCQQIARLERDVNREVLPAEDAIIRVGNLGAKRDFTDVRDVVRAYMLLLEKGEAGETYNVGSGVATSVSDILDIIVGYASVPIKVEIDEAKLRPIDVPIVEADILKLVSCTGWKPQIDIRDTILETLNWWRKNL